MSNTDGWVKVSAKTVWDTEEPEKQPTLEMRIELSQYTSRKQMTDVLRRLGNWIDEGVLHSFDLPRGEESYRGEWDDEEKIWRVYRDNGF